MTAEPDSGDAPAEGAAEEPPAEAEAAPVGGDVVEPTPQTEPLELDPNLLEGDAPATTPSTTDAGEVDDAGSEDALLRQEYENRYRPKSNPGRLNVTGRVLFANAGGREKIGGRMGGVQVDLGQAWNNIGYAGTVSAWGGRIFLPERTGAEMNAVFGAGPTLTMGRRALAGRGYADFRLGYDFLYGVVNRRRDAPTVVKPQGPNSDVVLEQTDNLAPHGPRVRLDLGLLLRAPHRRFNYGVGVSMGYQALVHSFRGSLPFTHMLTLGLSMWMG